MLSACARSCTSRGVTRGWTRTERGRWKEGDGAQRGVYADAPPEAAAALRAAGGSGGGSGSGSGSGGGEVGAMHRAHSAVGAMDKAKRPEFRGKNT